MVPLTPITAVARFWAVMDIVPPPGEDQVPLAPGVPAEHPDIEIASPADSRRSDIDLWQRELTVRGKGGKDRIVKIGHQAARSLDRYLRARSRHAQAWRPQLWLGPAAGSR